MFRAPSSRLLLGFVVACLLAAAALALSGRNHELFLALNNAAAARLPAALPSNLTILGHGLSAVMILAPWLLCAPRVVAAGILAVPAASLFTRLPKTLVDVRRPAAVLDPDSFHVHGMLLTSNNSFPSGHAITAFVVVAVLLLGVGSLRARPAAAAAVIAAGAVVALSRVMVGAHWPTDVLVGAALGSMAGASGVWAAARWRFWARPGGRLMLEAIVALCALVLLESDLGYPQAQPLQAALAALGLVSAVTAPVARWRAARRGADRAGAP